mmetsp:Transcript_59405/g.145901  ORF Transcript_59405/g.145901 Transcript_59405/m.145901 type:complete len:210 (-) Transcript_59405:705-1334(-)
MQPTAGQLPHHDRHHQLQAKELGLHKVDGCPLNVAPNRHWCSSPGAISFNISPLQDPAADVAHDPVVKGTVSLEGVLQRVNHVHVLRVVGLTHLLGEAPQPEFPERSAPRLCRPLQLANGSLLTIGKHLHEGGIDGGGGTDGRQLEEIPCRNHHHATKGDIKVARHNPAHVLEVSHTLHAQHGDFVKDDNPNLALLEHLNLVGDATPLL